MAAPLGNANAKRSREFRDALTWALDNYKGIKRGTALREIATKLVEEALSGGMAAITEIANRLDGKPAQDITATLTHITDASGLTDNDLADIATGGSERAAQEKASQKAVH